MEISKRDWKRYIDRLSAIDKKAADTMQFWMQENPDADVEELIWVAQNIAGRYGEAAGALACEMYDAVAAAQGAAVPPAEIADIPDYGETAKAVRGTLKNKQNTVPATVGRLVKRVGADTMLKNADRDHAQFAWIPMGDTCAFCMTLASRGWQYMSKDAMKHGHAEHIHANCDCTYAIRFDEKSTVEGYDPDKYREMYDNAEGDTPQEKINSMRREIAAKKRTAEETALSNRAADDIMKTVFEAAEQSRFKPGSDERALVSGVVATPEYEKRIKRLGENDEVTSVITHQARTTLWRRNGTPFEDLIFIDPESGEWLAQRNLDIVGGVSPTEKMKAMVLAKPGKIIAVHNHPHNMLPSYDDLINAKRYKSGVILCHNGSIIKYSVTEDADIASVNVLLDYIQKGFSEGDDISISLSGLAKYGVNMEVY